MLCVPTNPRSSAQKFDAMASSNQRTAMEDVVGNGYQGAYAILYSLLVSLPSVRLDAGLDDDEDCSTN